jgi:hypothetical protein
MQHGGTLQRSQDHVTDSHPESDKSNIRPQNLLPLIHFNTILPPTPISLKQPLSFRFFKQGFVSTSHIPVCTTRPAPLNLVDFITQSYIYFKSPGLR